MINSISHTPKSTPAFGSNRKSADYNPNKAVIAGILPGVPQILTKGTRGEGLLRIGIDAAALGTIIAVHKGKLGEKGKALAALVGAGIVALGNHTSSAISAFLPKKSD